ncbi:MAG: HU family DNA-binding protein [Deltaproteobacteria bacterium]|nr:HU family DNA-binding protein [Deltaproteobacteria bacterium]
MTTNDNEGLTRAEIIQALHERLAISRRDAKEILERFLEILSKSLVDGERISIYELGRFQVKPTPSRPGRNPKTGQPADVPAKNRPSFSMSRNLRAAMASWLDSLGGIGQSDLETKSKGETDQSGGNGLGTDN